MMICRFFLLLNLVCRGFPDQCFAQQADSRVAERCVAALTDVMTHDITSPPVAARNYCYTMLAFYEASRFAETGYRSYAGQLNNLSVVPQPEKKIEHDWLVAGATAFYHTAFALAFSKERFQGDWNAIKKDLEQRKITPEVYRRSVAYGEAVARHILSWSSNDGYKETRGLARFTAGSQAGNWQQTPPDYQEAVEPFWNKMRTLVLDSCNQIRIPSPPSYGSEAFEKDCREVFDMSTKLTGEQRDQAAFWDCNPFATTTVGHLVYGIKKISPPAHWIGITAIAVRQSKQALVPALASYTLVSISVYDAIIAAWDEKYRSDYIRPITAIQKLISPVWEPVLQTPPFPEYPSGHSVISMAAAEVLTKLYGPAFAYTDDVETAYGLKKRRFVSFYAAAEEAAMSRIYGGIHFRSAIEKGKTMGSQVGKMVISKIILM